jgi:ABC-type lipoprotein release transport system permease subunit
VLSYLVEQRRREIGVRKALGANRSDIGRLVLRTGLGATALGAGGAAVVACLLPAARAAGVEPTVTLRGE